MLMASAPNSYFPEYGEQSPKYRNDLVVGVYLSEPHTGSEMVGDYLISMRHK